MNPINYLHRTLFNEFQGVRWLCEGVLSVYFSGEWEERIYRAHSVRQAFPPTGFIQRCSSLSLMPVLFYDHWVGIVTLTLEQLQYDEGRSASRSKAVKATSSTAFSTICLSLMITEELQLLEKYIWHGPKYLMVLSALDSMIRGASTISTDSTCLILIFSALKIITTLLFFRCVFCCTVRCIASQEALTSDEGFLSYGFTLYASFTGAMLMVLCCQACVPFGLKWQIKRDSYTNSIRHELKGICSALFSSGNVHKIHHPVIKKGIKPKINCMSRINTRWHILHQQPICSV